MICLQNPCNRRSTVAGFCLATIILASLHPQIASADRRLYVWSYGYNTTTQGEMELEHYLTSTTANARHAGSTSWEQRFELETGLTRRWDFALYQIFSQPVGGDFHYDAFQLRTRYRLGEIGQWPVDPLLYLEYRRSSRFTDPNKFEGKLVLAHDFRRVNVAVNLIEELKFAPGAEYETGYATGISVELHPVFSIAAEAFGDIAKDGAKTHYAGPTISLSQDRWFYNIGVALGLNRASADVTARGIVGVDF